MRIAVVNLLPDSGRTTSAVHLAAGLAELASTLLVDADPRQTAFACGDLGGRAGLHVLGLPTRDVHRRLPELASGYAHVVIDTPAGDLGIVCSAVLAADRVVIPTPPWRDDLAGIRLTLDLLERVAAQPRDRVSILLGHISDRSGRLVADRLLRRFGYEARVLGAHVPTLAPAGLSAGLPGPGRAYRAVVDELVDLEELLSEVDVPVVGGGIAG